VVRPGGQVLDHAEAEQEARLETRLEISEPQILALVSIYREWHESLGKTLNEPHFLDFLAISLGEGTLVPCVLWDGDKPVGAAIMQIFREIFSGELAAMLGQLYIQPAYRGSRKGANMGMQLINFAHWCGISLVRVPARPELANYYWRHLPPGFKQSEIIFSKE
jgi:hypothetical protein